jgi:hypothetical protein
VSKNCGTNTVNYQSYNTLSVPHIRVCCNAKLVKKKRKPQIIKDMRVPHNFQADYRSILAVLLFNFYTQAIPFNPNMLHQLATDFCTQRKQCITQKRA